MNQFFNSCMWSLASRMTIVVEAINSSWCWIALTDCYLFLVKYETNALMILAPSPGKRVLALLETRVASKNCIKHEVSNRDFSLLTTSPGPCWSPEPGIVYMQLFLGGSYNKPVIQVENEDIPLSSYMCYYQCHPFGKNPRCYGQAKGERKILIQPYLKQGYFLWVMRTHTSLRSTTSN